MVERDTRHERYDFAARTIALFGAALIGALLLIAAVLQLAAGARRSAQRDAGFVDDGRRRPALQATPRIDLARYRREKQDQLESYGWVDHSGGVVHIPIERAMDIVARRSQAQERAR